MPAVVSVSTPQRTNHGTKDKVSDFAKELADEIRKANGGKSLINLAEVCRYMRCCRDTARKLLASVDYFQYEGGKEKLFRPIDIAKKMEEARNYIPPCLNTPRDAINDKFK